MKTCYKFLVATLLLMATFSAANTYAACGLPRGWSEKDTCPVFHFEGSNPLDSLGKPYVNGCLKYSWNFGDGYTADGRITAHTYTKNGTYTVCMKVKDTCKGCDTTICKTITIACLSSSSCKLPASWSQKDSCPVFRFEGANPLDSLGKPYVNGCLKYSWNFGDGYTADGRLATHTYTKGGAYTVCMKIKDTCKGCDTTICKTITVSCLPSSSCKLPSSWSQRDSCPVFRFEGSNSLDSLGKPYVNGCLKYSWNFGDGYTADGRLTTHTFKRNGVYTVCMKVKDTCKGCDTTICKTITISCLSHCRFPSGWSQKDSCGRFSFEGRNPVDSTGKSYVDTCLAYVWDFGDSTYAVGRIVKHAYASVGTYTICMHVADTCKKCDTTICTTVSVPCASPISVSIKTAVTSDTKTSVYPNPASGYFTISSNGPTDYKVFDTYGKIVRSGSFSESILVQSSELSNGIYIIQTTSKDQVQVVRLLIAK